MTDKQNKLWFHTRDPSYVSYMVRLWSSSREDGPATWQGSIKSPLTQEQRHFPDLESLFTYLRTMVEQAALEGAEDAEDAGGKSDNDAGRGGSRK